VLFGAGAAAVTIMGAAIVMSVLVLVGAIAGSATVVPAGEQDVLTFLTRHWQVPIPPQGRPPANFSPLEASLDAASCGVCHRAQFDDWKTSLHSKAMGPGVMGQTVGFIRDDPSKAIRCYACHAPLAEQQEKVRATKRSKGRYAENPAFQAALQAQGLTCAGCHVRAYVHYGPPKRDGSLENSRPATELPHRGAARTPAFERAEFCKDCHQFEPDGYAVNGKLLENTYNEWKESRYAKEGTSCQACHMPDRRHLWRGIHDPEMVRQGVSIRLALDKDRYRVGDRMEATVTLANTGVGHYFPTYVTPKVLVRFELVDADGNRVPGSLAEERIGRDVTLDLTGELFDTRIPPGASHAVRYVRTIEQAGLAVNVSVVVAPDDFYERFFETVVRTAESHRAQALLRQALDNARRSRFIVFQQDVRVS
jgi:hypothetical protein